MVRSKEEGCSATFNSYAFVQLEEKDRNLVFQSAGGSLFILLGKPAIVKMKKSILLKLA
jgi:hypothetical protein